MKINEINKPIYKKDHDEKCRGEIAYIGDVNIEGMLYGALYRSTIAYGKILKLSIPELPDGYAVITARDIPGDNYVKIISDDQPIFANEWVNYIGEPILMVVGEEMNIINEIMQKIEVLYETHTPILSLDDAIDKIKETTLVSYQFGENDEQIQSIEKNADQIVEKEFTTGYQEHVYVETQGMLATYSEDGIVVTGSMQCPYYIKNALMSALNCGDDDVRVVQTPTGGAFGGKEEFPSMMACHVAIASKVTKKPVKLIFNRTEDMQYTTKRHPSKMIYRTALDEKGNILSMSVKIYLNTGANLGLSSVVLQRSLINSAGVYKIPHFQAVGYALKTNTVPNGAFRGFGAPQSFSGIESLMGQLSKLAQKDPIDYKFQYLVQQGDPTITNGKFRDKIIVKEMAEDLLKKSNYRAIKQKASNDNRFKRGIGTSLFLHGCGFTGSGERDHIKATVTLDKTKDGKVMIKIANVDMGQGLITTMSKIVAKTMDMNYEDVYFPYPDTKEVPDSGPTVASRTTMIVGKLLERAASQLKEQWQDNMEQSVTEHYVHDEMIPWDEETFQGDAYPAYSWGVNIVEVLVDTLTGGVQLEKVYAAFDVGKAIDERIMKGQIDGGMAQSIAYGYMEKMESKNGLIMQRTITDYAPPTAMDVVNIDSQLYDNPYHNGPFGAKGAGELTMIGGAAAVQSAIEDALNVTFNQIPITPEVIIDRIG